MHLIVVTDPVFLLTDTKWPVQRNGVHGKQMGEAHRQWGMGLSFCKCMKNSFMKFFFPLISFNFLCLDGLAVVNAFEEAELS